MMTRRRISLLTVSATVVAAGAYWALHDGKSGTLLTAISPATRDSGTLLPGVSSMSAAAADAQRTLHYQDLDTVSQIRELPSAFARREALYAVAGRAGAAQLRRLITEAGRISGESERVQALEILLDDPHRAIAEALRLPPDARQQQLLKIAQAWARISPEEAWEHAPQLDDPGVRSAFQNAVAETWLMQQPEAVFARVLELPAGSQRTQLLRDATLELTSRNPQQAIALLGCNPALRASCPVAGRRRAVHRDSHDTDPPLRRDRGCL